MNASDHASLDGKRILVAEDDPVSASFLHDALSGLGARVYSVDDGERAWLAACRERYDLLLLDCRLPGMGALQLVRALRKNPESASRQVPVLATSAEVDNALADALHAAGCGRLLPKPLSVEQLEAAVRSCLHMPASPVIDDDAGLEASGSIENRDALRNLFRGELLALTAEWPQLCARPGTLRERLHRLRASCGLCGAHALDHACAELAASLDGGSNIHAQATMHFETVMCETLWALRAHDDGSVMPNDQS